MPLGLEGLITLFKFDFQGTIHLLPDIHIHFHGQDEDRPSSTVVLSERTPEIQSPDSQRTYAITERPEQDDVPKLQEVRLPFGTGLHFVVDQKEWWSSNQQISIGNARLIPLTLGSELLIPRSGNSKYFKACFTSASEFEVAIWESEPYRLVKSNRSKYITIPELSDHKWCFSRYLPKESVVLNRFPPVVVTFSQDHVDSAWLIRYDRSGFEEEVFLFVLEKSI